MAWGLVNLSKSVISLDTGCFLAMFLSYGMRWASGSNSANMLMASVNSLIAKELLSLDPKRENLSPKMNFPPPLGLRLLMLLLLLWVYPSKVDLAEEVLWELAIRSSSRRNSLPLMVQSLRLLGCQNTVKQEDACWLLISLGCCTDCSTVTRGLKGMQVYPLE